MKRTKLLFSSLVAVGLFALAPTFAQQENQLVRSNAIFDGKARVRDAKATAELRDTQVRIQNVAIVGGQKLESLGLRSNSLTIVQLRGGKLITVINGKRQERQEGEFWTVPAGATMSVETEDDTATIQTIEISRP
jgi:quercetin dioxygenase-like cupin family protein